MPILDERSLLFDYLNRHVSGDSLACCTNVTRTQKMRHDSDEFRMFAFKIKRCSKTRSHDWTECPFAHRGEKARRRDPRKHPYAGVACAEFRSSGECGKGQQCEFAHGVFEFWLHPSRYRTRPCNAGVQCRRKVCFFAHTPEQLRGGKRYEGVCDGLGLDIGSGEERSKGGGTGGGELSDLPDIGWIFELVK